MPKLIRRRDVEAEYGITERQAKRWIVERKISHVHLTGPTGPCWLLVDEIDSLIAETTTPALKRHRGKAS
jgi:hypothetical protein